MVPCDACMRIKAKAKAVKKKTDVKATKIGEHLFLDTSGPFAPSLKGSKYWGEICDQWTGKTWDSFLKQKSDIPEMVEDLIIKLKAKNFEVKFLRCDNAGEHEEKLQKICHQLGVDLEYVAPHTPQHNGVVERRFVTDRNRAMAMMIGANFSQETQDLLRCEAINTASVLGDILVRQGLSKSAYELFYGKPSPLLPYLVEFGRIGYVTDRTPIKKKWRENSYKCIMVGYGEDHNPDTYRMFNPETREVILSRDVRWAAWSRRTPSADMAEFADPPGVDQPPEPIEVPSTSPTIHVIPPEATAPIGEDETVDTDDDDLALDDSRKTQQPTIVAEPTTTKNTTTTPRKEKAEKAMRLFKHRQYVTRSYAKSQAKQLEPSPKIAEVEPEPTEKQPETVEVPAVPEQQQVHESTCNSAIVSDPGEPRNWKDALSRGWHDPMASECMNFINRKAWMKVERTLVKKLNKKPIGTKWVFKIKNLHDGSQKRKARCVVQGFKQIPGVDYTESFSPVATDSSIRSVIGIFLFMHHMFKDTGGWTLEMFDVEAAFLNADIEQRMFVEWPKGMEELGFITPQDREKYCIELGKTMYGDIGAPIRWMRTISGTLINDMKMKQSDVDPCIFYKHDKTGKLLLLCALFVDDTLITGRKEDVRSFYNDIQKHYNIEILGTLSKHLGITWTWSKSKGETELIATMPQMEKDIIEAAEKVLNKTLKPQPTPGYPGKTLIKNEGEPVNLDEYRSIVGKLLYYMTKVAPEMANACRELSSHMSNPGPLHWKSIERIVGYLKYKDGKGLTL